MQACQVWHPGETPVPSLHNVGKSEGWSERPQVSSHEERPPRVEQIWCGGREARENAFPPLGSSSCHCHGYLCFLFDSSQTAEVRGAGTGSQLRPPLRGAVYNSRIWDSQKETPNRTSCGCKIPRCQELKIAATEPQPPRGDGERGMLTVEAGGWPAATETYPVSALWVHSYQTSRACCPFALGDRKLPSGQADIPGCSPAS